MTHVLILLCPSAELRMWSYEYGAKSEVYVFFLKKQGICIFRRIICCQAWQGIGNAQEHSYMGAEQR
jgi:hypothetical protein